MIGFVYQNQVGTSQFCQHQHQQAQKKDKLDLKKSQSGVFKMWLLGQCILCVVWVLVQVPVPMSYCIYKKPISGPIGKILAYTDAGTFKCLRGSPSLKKVTLIWTKINSKIIFVRNVWLKSCVHLKKKNPFFLNSVLFLENTISFLGALFFFTEHPIFFSVHLIFFRASYYFLFTLF